MQDPGPCSSPFMPGPCPYLIQSHGEGSGGQWGWGIIPGCTPFADACLLQELIYKEFFSQGDLVGTWQGWAWPMLLAGTNGMGGMGSEQRGLAWEWEEVSLALTPLTIHAGESHGEQPTGDDGPGESLHPRAADQLHGAHCHAHLQVSPSARAAVGRTPCHPHLP